MDKIVFKDTGKSIGFLERFFEDIFEGVKTATRRVTVLPKKGDIFEIKKMGAFIRVWHIHQEPLTTIALYGPRVVGQEGCETISEFRSVWDETHDEGLKFKDNPKVNVIRFQYQPTLKDALEQPFEIHFPTIDELNIPGTRRRETKKAKRGGFIQGQDGG